MDTETLCSEIRVFHGLIHGLTRYGPRDERLLATLNDELDARWVELAAMDDAERRQSLRTVG